MAAKQLSTQQKKSLVQKLVPALVLVLVVAVAGLIGYKVTNSPDKKGDTNLPTQPPKGNIKVTPHEGSIEVLPLPPKGKPQPKLPGTG